jgi:hypothetical protein
MEDFIKMRFLNKKFEEIISKKYEKLFYHQRILKNQIKNHQQFDWFKVWKMKTNVQNVRENSRQKIMEKSIIKK